MGHEFKWCSPMVMDDLLADELAAMEAFMAQLERDTDG